MEKIYESLGGEYNQCYAAVSQIYMPRIVINLTHKNEEIKLHHAYIYHFLPLMRIQKCHDPRELWDLI